MSSIDRQRLIDIFEAMDEAATGPQTICVIGAAAILMHGHTLRQTQDVDIWRPASRLNDRELRRLAGSVGLDYNPTELAPSRIYLQVVDPGIRWSIRASCNCRSSPRESGRPERRAKPYGKVSI